MQRYKSARFILTRNCSYNCYYCHNEGAGKGDDFDNNNKLDINDFKFLSEILVDEFGLEKITFTGGDPFLFKGVEQLAHNLSHKGVRVKAITRGAPLLPLIENNVIKKDDFDHICFSIDTLIPSKFSEITRVDERLLQKGITALKKTIELGIPARIHVVVQKENYDGKDIISILDFASENNVDSVKMYEIMDPGKIKEPYLEDILTEINILPKELTPKKLAVRYHFPYKNTTITPTRCLCNLAIFNQTCPCTGQSLMFDPQGRVNTCLFWDVHTNPYRIELFEEIKAKDKNAIIEKLHKYQQHKCPLLMTKEERENKNAGLELGGYH